MCCDDGDGHVDGEICADDMKCQNGGADSEVDLKNVVSYST